MNDRKARFLAKYGGPEQIQHVLDKDGVEHYSYNPTAMKNHFMTKDQLHYIIRGTESRRVREIAMDSPVFGSEHIEQMLTDGAAGWEERQALARHPKLTVNQAKRILDDPNELSQIKSTVLTMTPHKEVLDHALTQDDTKDHWVTGNAILKNKHITKDMHDQLLSHKHPIVRFGAMEHHLATEEDVQNYIKNEDPSEEEGLTFARHKLEDIKLGKAKEAARAELRGMGLMKDKQ